MKQQMVFGLLFGLICACPAFADTHYVVKDNPGAASPFTSWTTAATNIQQAIDNAACVNGDTVLVTNSATAYSPVSITTKRVVLRSFNNGATDPTNTIIDGNNSAQCLYLYYSGGNVTIDGFTIRRGNAGSGGGIYWRYGGILTNCIVDSNNATVEGGGIYLLWVDGAFVITRCTIRNNTAAGAGGGIYQHGWSSPVAISDCLIAENSGLNGGGLYISSPITPGVGSRTVRNCVIRGNSLAATGTGSGGGVMCNNGDATVLVENCTIISNRQSWYFVDASGAGADMAGGGIRNCLIAGNYSGSRLPSTVSGGIMVNCTVVSNTYGARGSYVTNSIIYDNVGWDVTNCSMSYSCAPITNYVAGINNITSAPALMTSAAGPYRLSPNSPCINAGINQGWMNTAADMDGHRRIIEGTVDMGAFEFLHQGGILSIR